MYWDSIDYLKKGDMLQKLAFETLNSSKIIALLNQFDALLAGTYPLGIHTEKSDLDILCYCPEFKSLISFCELRWSNMPEFSVEIKPIRSISTCIIRFRMDGIPIEIFAQNVPVKEQMAYFHLIKEWEILEQKDAVFKNAIIALKEKGIKTEAAFAILLKIEGDPYLNLLNYKSNKSQ